MATVGASSRSGSIRAVQGTLPELETDRARGERRRFGLRFRQLLLAVGWLSTNFLVYRLGLWLIGWRRPCGCLGNLTDLLHISPRLADNVMKGVLAYLLVGSYAILIWEWRRGRGARAAEAVPAMATAEEVEGVK